MKKTAKILGCLSMGAILSASMLAGCGQSGIPPRDYLKFFVWGEPTEQSYYDEIAEMYTEQYGFQVIVENQPGDYYTNLNLALNGGASAPDIFFTEKGQLKGLLEAEQVLNLTPYMESGALDIKSDSNTDGTIELWDLNKEYAVSDQYYAMIKDLSADHMLWYNKSHIDEYNAGKPSSQKIAYPDPEIPMTWSEFADMSRKLAKFNGDNFVRYGAKLGQSPWAHLMEMVQMTGETLFDSQKKYMNTSANVEKAFEHFSKLQYGDNKSVDKVIGASTISSGAMFANGQASMVFLGSWAFANYQWDSLDFEFGIAPPPLPDQDTPLTKEDRYATCAAMTGLAVNVDTPNADRVIEFLNFYMTKGQEYFANIGFNVPGNKLVAESDLYLYPDSSLLGEVNRTFYDAMSFTHALTYNEFTTQKKVGDAINDQLDLLYAKPVSDWNMKNTLNAIAAQIRSEID